MGAREGMRAWGADKGKGKGKGKGGWLTAIGSEGWRNGAGTRATDRNARTPPRGGFAPGRPTERTEPRKDDEASRRRRERDESAKRRRNRDESAKRRKNRGGSQKRRKDRDESPTRKKSRDESPKKKDRKQSPRRR